jgi:hypothetical protein
VQTIVLLLTLETRDYCHVLLSYLLQAFLSDAITTIMIPAVNQRSIYSRITTYYAGNIGLAVTEGLNKISLF